MELLANLLSALGQPVIDKTGLKGSYDFTLSWDEAEGPHLPTALAEQLGLKIEARKVPVSYLLWSRRRTDDCKRRRRLALFGSAWRALLREEMPPAM